MRCRLATTPLVLAVLAQVAAEAAPAQRGMTVEDVLSIERLSTIALSPDGAWAAVAIQRARRDAGFHGRTRLGGDDRADLWLVATATGERRRLTDGAADGSGWWAPAWSADGERLAMLSTRGGDQVRLYVWARSDGTLERVADEGIHPGAALEAGGSEGYGFVWVDATTLLAVFVPPGLRPFDFGGDHETQAVAPDLWKRAQLGREPTASVLVSGPAGPPPVGIATVATVDAVRRRSTPLARVSLALLSAPAASLSPDGLHLALFETSPLPPSPGRPMTFAGRDRTRVGLVRIGSGSDRPEWLEAIPRPSPASVEWLADGSALAALVPREPGGADEAVLLVDTSSRETRRLTPDAWRVQSLRGAGPEGLLVQAVAGEVGAGTASRADWWLVPPRGEPRNLTASLPEPPATLEAGPGGSFLAIASRDLWQIAEGEPRNLTESLAPPVRSLVPRSGPSENEDLAEFLFAAGEGEEVRAHRIAIGGNAPAIHPLPRPSARATAKAHWPAGRAAVLEAVEERGVFAWAVDLPTGRATRLASLNEHLADVAPARRMGIEYRGANGRSLQGIVLLPHDHEAGKRYPLLAWIYGGDVFRDAGSRRSLTDKYNDDWLAMLPLVARGYVVLLPSIPLGPEGEPGEPMADIPRCALSAVDRLIELGIADPERLAVAGHSYGGYSTLCVVASTNRFKAAIALAGASDLITQHGTLDARFRYGDAATEGLSQMRLLEGGQGRMGRPPHEDLARYLRNSPLFLVDRVQTPILLVHGDIDFVPIMQAEAFFLALLRLGRPARFLRYFGEGHSIESPANIRHLWGEIFAWLDAHLRPEGRTAPPR